MYKVIIVDDNKRERQYIADIVKESGIPLESIDIYSNAMKVLEEINRINPDIILADISMPVVSGIEMMQKIRERHEQVKVIFISCYNEFDFAKAALDLKIYRYLLKPIKKYELIQSIEDVVNIIKSEKKNAEERKQLKEQLKQSLPVMREQFFRDLMFGKFRNYREIKQNMSYFAIDLPDDYSIRLMLLSLKNDSKEGFNLDSHYLSLISIKDTIRSIENEFEHIYVMQISLTQIALITIIDAQKSVDKDEFDVMIQIYSKLEDEIDLPIRAAISKTSKYLVEMPELFDQCVKTLNAGIYDEFERVLLFEELDNKPEENFVEKVDLQCLYTELKDLFDATAEDFTRLVNGFIDKHLHDGKPYSKVHIVGFIYSLVNFVNIINLEKAGENETIKLDIGIWKQIKDLRNLEETKQWVNDHIVSYYKKYHERNTGAYSKIANDIKTIVHNQYKLDLTLQKISDKLGYSANHLNNIFKQLNNKTIFDYLTAYRIEKAKELLKDPYIKIYEVADQVGYGNKSHFSYQFKKIAGMTPLQYKISHE